AYTNQPAQADLTTGSSLSGGTNGPFSISVNSGAALANVSIDLTDPEADNITVASITPPGTVPTGITPPSIPTPGQPLTLSRTGTADASNRSEERRVGKERRPRWSPYHEHIVRPERCSDGAD